MKDKHVLGLVKKSVSGNREAFGDLCELKAREITYLCLREMGNLEDGKDAAQEVFIRMHQSITSLRSPNAFHIWLNRVILSTCNDLRRKSMKQAPNVSYDDALEKENIADVGNMLPVDFVESEENRKQIIELVDALPHKYRRCVLLHYYQNLSYAEIARVLDIPRDAVNNNLRMARQYLKAEIEKKHDNYHSLAAMPMTAMGPALIKIFEQSAAHEVPQVLAQECLAKAGVDAALPSAKLMSGVAIKISAGLFAVAFAATAACTAYSLTRQTSYSGSGVTESAQSPVVASSMVQALPTSLSGHVNLPTENGGITASLPAGTQVALLAPTGESVAVTALLPDGSFCFEDLQLTLAGAYTLRVLLHEAETKTAIDELIVVLTEEGTVPN